MSADDVINLLMTFDLICSFSSNSNVEVGGDLYTDGQSGVLVQAYFTKICYMACTAVDAAFIFKDV